jgi:hypothetical protein
MAKTTLCDFEGTGPAGTTLTQANTNSTLPVLGTGCTAVSTSSAAYGSFAGSFTVPATNVSSRVTNAAAGGMQFALSFKFRVPTGFATSKQILNLQNGAAGRIGAFNYNGSTNRFQIQNSAGAGTITVGFTLTLNTWYRVEAVITVATVGSIKLNIYDNEGTTPLIAQTVNNAYDLGTSALAAIQHGINSNGTTVAATVDIDSVRFDPGGVFELGPEALTAISSDSDERWLVYNRPNSDADLRWGVRSSSNSDLDARWGVRSSLSTDLDARWRSFVLVQADADLRWLVHNRANSDADLRYLVRNALTSDLDSRWGVRFNLSSDLDARWLVRALVTADADARWLVRNRISADVDSRWLVRNALASDLDARWRSFVLTQADSDLRWRSFNQASADLDLRWLVRAGLSTDLISRWLVHNQVSAALSARWRVYSPPRDVLLAATLAEQERIVGALSEQGRIAATLGAQDG